MKKNSHGHNFYLSTMGWNPFCANTYFAESVHFPETFNFIIAQKHLRLILCAKNNIFSL